MYKGVIIEESLADKSVLKKVQILSTEAEQATERHRTPWVEKWTLHTVQIPDEQAEAIANEIKNSLDPDHAWYADFKNDTRHYIIFRDKVFFIDRTSKEQYDRAREHGLSLGIPAHQVDFHPEIEEWER